MLALSSVSLLLPLAGRLEHPPLRSGGRPSRARRGAGGAARGAAVQGLDRGETEKDLGLGIADAVITQLAKCGRCASGRPRR